MQEVFNSGRHFISRNKNGNIDTVIAGEKVTLETSVGSLIPRFTLDDEGRKKESPVKFYRSGELKSAPLENITEITTSAGTIKAELVTFYKSGALWRIFPLDGKITGFWTEENEYELAQILDIPTSLGAIAVKPIYLQFYETGELESVLFWPEERVTLNTSKGEYEIKKGICFHKNGAIKGFEPADEITVESSIGKLKVYDPDPNGILAESNSIGFTEDGSIHNIITSSSQINVIVDGTIDKSFGPKMVTSYCNENAFFISPLRITFEKESITFANDNEPPVTISADLRFKITPFVSLRPISCVGCG